jgi:uncharacterized protein
MGLASSGMCVFNETCGLGVALEHNGDLYSCDHFVEPDYLLGNIGDVDMGDLVGSARQHTFGMDKRDSLPSFCLECDVRFACQGECPKNRFVATPEGEAGLNYLCTGFKDFFHHIDEPMKDIVEALENGRMAATAMPVIAARDVAFYRRVHAAGRNGPCPCGSGEKTKRCHGAGRPGTATQPSMPTEPGQPRLRVRDRS